MVSMNSIMNTGRQGIISQQSALAITGNNIANVNTPGYSRQRADLESLATGGVTLSGVERLRDQFLVTRLYDVNAQAEGSATLATNLQHIEAIMGETADSGASKSLSDFFSSLQDLTLQPAGTAERETVRSRGSQLVSTLSSMAGQLRDTRTQIDQQISGTVNQANALTREIADLNKKISGLGVNNSELQSLGVNQILDQRDQRINELSKIMPLNVIQGSNNSVTIFGSGQTLVEGINQRALTTVSNPANDGMQDVMMQDSAGNVRSLVGNLKTGSLGALLQARDVDAKQALDSVERLAATVVQTVNEQHRAGTGTDGVSGRNFFDGLATSAAGSWSNAGKVAVASTAVLNDTQLTFHDYEIRFTAANKFDIVDTTSGTAVSNNNTYTSGGPIDFAGMRVVLNNNGGTPAVGDVFHVNSYDDTTQRMTLSAAVTANTSAIAAGLSGAPGDNQNVLTLAALRDAMTMGQPPTQNFETYYNAVRLKQSMSTQSAQNSMTDSAISQQQIQGMNDAVSGVSTDEEATNIIQYQRAFEASSRIIRSVDEMMQSLLNMF